MNSIYTNEFLERVFRGTSENDREALYLRYHSSYSIGDIADILGISTVKARKHCRHGVKKVMKNVLNATPIQKVSLDDILGSNLLPLRPRERNEGFDSVSYSELLPDDEPKLLPGQRPMLRLWFGAV